MRKVFSGSRVVRFLTKDILGQTQRATESARSCRIVRKASAAQVIVGVNQIKSVSCSMVIKTVEVAASSILSLPKKLKYIGAHISASGGPEKAVQRALALGPLARSFAFFIRPRLSWRPIAPFDEQTIQRFHDAIDKAPQFQKQYVVVHGSYLLNLASHDATQREKSIQLMIEEVSKCQSLGIQLYVFHPGSCTRWTSDQEQSQNQKKRKKLKTKEKIDDSDEIDTEMERRRTESIQHIANCMLKVLHATKDVTLVVENMCGQGNTIGGTFQELRAILDAVDALIVNQSCSTATTDRSRLGICLDTCHAFASGWDLTTRTECEQMMQAFHECMGSKWHNVLKVVHVNDSKTSCGSRVDRHANIGHGYIGLEAFRWLMESSYFENIPLILETPIVESKKKNKSEEKENGNNTKQPESEKSVEERSTKKKSRKRNSDRSMNEFEGVKHPREEVELLVGLIQEK